MRIKYHVGSVILICSLGGLALALGLARLQRGIENEVRELGPDSLAVQSAGRLQTLVGQWLLSCDLVLSGTGGTYLLEGSTQQAGEAVALIHDLQRFRLAAGEVSRLEVMNARIRRVDHLVAEAARTSGPDRLRRLNRYSAEVDAETEPLVADVSRLSGALGAGAAEAARLVEVQRARLRAATWLAGTLYAAVVFAVWRWTSLKMVRPLQTLTAAADRVAAGDLDVHLSTTSSDELGELVRTFEYMVANLRESTDSMRRYQSTLECAIAERTAALQATTNEATDLAQRAEQASAAKSAFLANMSHELRTPLNSIIGYSEMLVEDGVAELGASRAEDLERITKAGRHLLSLIDTILELSRIEAGQMRLRIEAFDAATLVESVVDIGQALARQNDIDLTAQGLEALGLMHSDRTKLRQILLNLVGNACKFNKRCQVEVQCRREQRAGRAWLVFDVRDDGVGIPQETLARLFRHFEQGDAGTTRRQGGTGLGLAISRRLAELLGGTLAVESAVAAGATFTLSVPAAAPAHAPSSLRVPDAADLDKGEERIEAPPEVVGLGAAS